MPLVETPVPDLITSLETTILVAAEDDPPSDTLAPPTVFAISLLRDDEDIDWVRGISVRFPNGTMEWMAYHSENQDEFGDLEPNHGDVYQADFVEGVADPDEDGFAEEAEYAGRLASMEPIRTGVDEEVRREDLTDEAHTYYECLMDQVNNEGS